MFLILLFIQLSKIRADPTKEIIEDQIGLYNFIIKIYINYLFYKKKEQSILK